MNERQRKDKNISTTLKVRMISKVSCVKKNKYCSSIASVTCRNDYAKYIFGGESHLGMSESSKRGQYRGYDIWNFVKCILKQ